MSELVIVDIDAKTFASPYNDIANFPADIVCPHLLRSSARRGTS